MTARKPKTPVEETPVEETPVEPVEETPVEETPVEPVEETFESNHVLDEPVEATIEPIGDGPTEVGQFVGYGAEQTARHDGEWLVDPETGLITGPA